jgi:hypothetical protein
VQPYLTNLFTTTVVLYWAAFVYHFFLASEISMLGTSIPLVVNFAKSSGMSPLLLGMIWTFAAGGKLFAYQSGVLIVGYSYGYFEARDLLRLRLVAHGGGVRDAGATGADLLAADRDFVRAVRAARFSSTTGLLPFDILGSFRSNHNLCLFL